MTEISEFIGVGWKFVTPAMGAELFIHVSVPFGSVFIYTCNTEININTTDTCVNYGGNTYHRTRCLYVLQILRLLLADPDPNKIERTCV